MIKQYWGEDTDPKLLKKYKRDAPKSVSKSGANSFKKNVSKKSRKEWGERMNHLRSIK